MAVVRRVLSWRGIKGWVYLDDILLSAMRNRRLRRAVRECKRLLQRARFIVGAKSETTPTETHLDTRAGTISNAVGAVVGAFRAWVRGVGRGRLPSMAMGRLLGKLCWLGMPNAGLGAFLAGAYSALHRGLGLFGRGVAKGIATVLLFSCIPQQADPWDGVIHPLGKFYGRGPRGLWFQGGHCGGEGVLPVTALPPLGRLPPEG